MCDIENCEILKLKDDLGLVRSDLLSAEEKEDLDYNSLPSVDWINSQFSLDRTLYIERFEKKDDAVLGRIYLRGLLVGYSLEKFSKIIAEGQYSMKITHSPRFGRFTPEIVVPNRVGLRIHVGNYLKDTNGCVLCGFSYSGVVLKSSSVCFDFLVYNIRNCEINVIRFINHF